MTSKQKKPHKRNITKQKPYNRGGHDTIVKSLEERLNGMDREWDFIKHNVEYVRGNVVGECDLWARYTSPYTGKSYDLFFEVKCNSTRRTGAYKQLKKDIKHLADSDKQYAFFASKDYIKWARDLYTR